MEHIGKAIDSSGIGKHTRGRKIKKLPTIPGPNLEEQREQLRKSLIISSLDNTFDNFKATQGTGRAFAHFKALATGEADWQMLLCYGGTGNGTGIDGAIFAGTSGQKEIPAGKLWKSGHKGFIWNP